MVLQRFDFGDTMKQWLLKHRKMAYIGMRMLKNK